MSNLLKKPRILILSDNKETKTPRSISKELRIKIEEALIGQCWDNLNINKKLEVQWIKNRKLGKYLNSQVFLVEVFHVRKKEG